MNCYTVNKPNGFNIGISLVSLPIGEERYGVQLDPQLHIPLDREEPASIVWVGDGHPIIRTANLVRGPLLTFSSPGLNQESAEDCLILVDGYLSPEIGQYHSLTPRGEGCKNVGTGIVADSIPVEFGWENPDMHSRFYVEAWHVRELIQLSLGGYIKVGWLGAKRTDRYPFSEYVITYNIVEKKGRQRPEIRIVSEESFERTATDRSQPIALTTR